MLTGKIFQEVTGHDYREFGSTIDIWDAVKGAKDVKEFDADRYKSNVVSNRGGVFAHKTFDDDIDSRLR